MVTAHFWLLVAVLITAVFSQEEKAKDEETLVFVKGEDLYLKCGEGCIWKKDDLNGITVTSGKDHHLGSLWNDPRGVYSRTMNTKTSKPKYVNVYVRKCMNCIDLDPGTVAGFIVADVIMIGLIAMAVYFVSGSETRRPGRASDKQNLIDKDTEYQMLGHRDNEQYSHLAPRPKRGGF